MHLKNYQQLKINLNFAFITFSGTIQKAMNIVVKGYISMDVHRDMGVSCMLVYMHENSTPKVTYLTLWHIFFQIIAITIAITIITTRFLEEKDMLQICNPHCYFFHLYPLLTQSQININ